MKARTDRKALTPRSGNGPGSQPSSSSTSPTSAAAAESAGAASAGTPAPSPNATVDPPRSRRGRTAASSTAGHATAGPRSAGGSRSRPRGWAALAKPDYLPARIDRGGERSSDGDYDRSQSVSKPLEGVKVVELAGWA